MSNKLRKEIVSIEDAAILWKLHERLESLQRDIDYNEKTSFPSAVDRYFDAPSYEEDKYAHRYAKTDISHVKIGTALNKILMEYIGSLSAADFKAKVVGKGNPWAVEIQESPKVEEPLI
jgi:hypothetical protein